MKKINEIYKNYLNNKGIFSFFTQSFEWLTDENKNELNVLYHGFRSGEKTASSFLQKLYDEEEGITDNNATLICNLLYVKFAKNWNKLWDTLNFEYNAIENYSMIETETKDGAENYRETVESGSNTNIKNGSEIETITGTETNESEIAGYNSDEYVNDSKNTTEYNNRQNTKNYNNLTDDDTYENTKKESEYENRELKRSGNIGVTTSQQMIQSERDLWMWNFYDKIFEDIDSLLTLSVWD